MRIALHKKPVEVIIVVGKIVIFFIAGDPLSQLDDWGTVENEGMLGSRLFHRPCSLDTNQGEGVSMRLNPKDNINASLYGRLFLSMQLIDHAAT